MTDLYLRRPRWSATAVIVPAGAALLTGATAWALHSNAPAPVAVPAAAPAAAAPAADQASADQASADQAAAAGAEDPVLVSLRTAIEKNQAEVEALQKKVTDLNTKAAKAKGTAATAIKAQQNYAKVTIPTAPKKVYVKAAAPKTNTSTGASG